MPDTPDQRTKIADQPIPRTPMPSAIDAARDEP
jgi:hypothetical protein